MNLQPDGETNLTFRFPTILYILMSRLSIAIEKWKFSSKMIITCRDTLTKFSTAFYYAWCILLILSIFLQGQTTVTGTRKDFN